VVLRAVFILEQEFSNSFSLAYLGIKCKNIIVLPIVVRLMPKIAKKKDY